MKASRENPEYTAVLITLSEEKYELTPVLTSLTLSHQKEQLAVCATLRLMNLFYEGTWLNAMVEVRQQVYLYANDGERHEEVFRGFVWSLDYTSETDSREIVLRCYDNLIFLQESEDTAFFPAGWRTQDALTSICGNWGIPLRYAYESISHEKLALRGTLSDLLTADLLDPVRKRTGKKYAILMEKNTMVVRTAGDNKTYYRIEGASNAIRTKNSVTMDGMTTKVVLLGKAVDNGKTPIEATVSGDTTKYGTLQKLQDKKEDTTLSAAKEEAQTLLKEKGLPTVTFELVCSDIPWIRKGDRIYISVGGIYQKTLLVWGVEHSISNKGKTVTLTMEEPT